MSDLISRKTAIETAKKMYVACDTNSIDDYEMLMEEALKVLPSAEPQIIRCKDCKWNRTENRKESTQWLPCRALVTPDDFSCIYADRRTE